MDYFGSSVIRSPDHLAKGLLRVVDDGRAEVGYLNLIAFPKLKDVLQFEISVDDVLTVKVVDASQNLLHHGNHFCLWKPPVPLQSGEEVAAFAQLSDEVVVVAILLDLMQSYDIRMFQVLQYSDFIEQCLLLAFLQLWLDYDLHCTLHPGLPLDAFADFTEGVRAEELVAYAVATSEGTIWAKWSVLFPKSLLLGLDLVLSCTCILLQQ